MGTYNYCICKIWHNAFLVVFWLRVFLVIGAWWTTSRKCSPLGVHPIDLPDEGSLMLLRSCMRWFDGLKLITLYHSTTCWSRSNVARYQASFINGHCILENLLVVKLSQSDIWKTCFEKELLVDPCPIWQATPTMWDFTQKMCSLQKFLEILQCVNFLIGNTHCNGRSSMFEWCYVYCTSCKHDHFLVPTTNVFSGELWEYLSFTCINSYSEQDTYDIPTVNEQITHICLPYIALDAVDLTLWNGAGSTYKDISHTDGKKFTLFQAIFP